MQIQIRTPKTSVSLVSDAEVDKLNSELETVIYDKIKSYFEDVLNAKINGKPIPPRRKPAFIK